MRILPLVLVLIQLSCQKTTKEDVSRETPGDYIFLTHYISLQCGDCAEDFKYSHKIGLEESGFTATDMPFRNGRVVKSRIDQGLQLETVWEKTDETTNCKMTITTERDGTYISTASTCEIL